jgi:hypothetical protein
MLCTCESRRQHWTILPWILPQLSNTVLGSTITLKQCRASQIEDKRTSGNYNYVVSFICCTFLCLSLNMSADIPRCHQNVPETYTCPSLTATSSDFLRFLTRGLDSFSTAMVSALAYAILKVARTIPNSREIPRVLAFPQHTFPSCCVGSDFEAYHDSFLHAPYFSSLHKNTPSSPSAPFPCAPAPFLCSGAAAAVPFTAAPS